MASHENLEENADSICKDEESAFLSDREVLSRFKRHRQSLSKSTKIFRKLDYVSMDPLCYHEVFNIPESFNQAWNHPDPFQSVY
jgi:hypothetical protein